VRNWNRGSENVKFTSKPKDQTQSLEEKIRSVRDECDDFLDAKAAELKKEAPGVPVGVLRNIICARAMNCPCRAVLNNLED
jgi:hypothetical protein